jgi:hypothetical protein
MGHSDTPPVSPERGIDGGSPSVRFSLRIKIKFSLEKGEKRLYYVIANKRILGRRKLG